MKESQNQCAQNGVYTHSMTQSLVYLKFFSDDKILLSCFSYNGISSFEVTRELIANYSKVSLDSLTKEQRSNLFAFLLEN
jgi:hypothetical protein